MRQGGYEHLVTYHERFNEVLKAYNDQKNSAMMKEAIAMDFFNGLDNARCATIKTNIYNGTMEGSIKPPPMVNKVYEMAMGYLKTNAIQQGCLGTTFATKLDNVERKHGKKKEKTQELYRGRWPT
jgi:hypothetical protein